MRLALALALVLALPATAAASTASVVHGILGDEIHFRAGAGETNQATIRFDFARYQNTVYDPGSTITPERGCTAIGPSWVECRSGNASILADLGDGNDLLDLSNPMPLGHQVHVSLGPGDDVLRSPKSSRPSRFQVTGDAGNDEIEGGPYEDNLDGGEGDDRILAAGDAGPESTETITCGPGNDSAEVDSTDQVAADCETVTRIPIQEDPTGPGAASCVVPKLKGLTLKAAKARLTRARCRLGKVKRAYSRRVKKGRVISQSRKPRVRLKSGAKVGVTLSRGKRRR